MAALPSPASPRTKRAAAPRASSCATTRPWPRPAAATAAVPGVAAAAAAVAEADEGLLLDDVGAAATVVAPSVEMGLYADLQDMGGMEDI